MRITGGSARGILLDVPRGVEYLRPATDFLREAVFSALGKTVQNAIVLDLFAGVGSYGLEALSRGAKACVFVDKNRLASDAIESNLERVKKSAGRDFGSKVFCRDIFAFAETCSATFDIIFIDPPYNAMETLGMKCLQTFSRFLEDSNASRIVIEVPGSCKINAEPDIIELRRLGRKSNCQQPNAVIYGKK
ncbi:MAG: RsmD family RNA methyltransferase [Puniceicoccales bacterium]|jgi:16S rRNA (guanine966-N2)-methyltransferase|nr:RsmD family RNA methyltransferase [Puniceicoccales bacterium]